MEKLQKNDRIKKQVLTNLGIYGRRILEDEAQEITATSKLVNSMGYVVRGDRAEIGSRVDYAVQALETGTPKGTIIRPEALERWVGKRYGGTAKKKKAIAKAISRKIARLGSKKYREGGPKQLTKATEKINKGIDLELTKLAGYYD